MIFLADALFCERLVCTERVIDLKFYQSHKISSSCNSFALPKKSSPGLPIGTPFLIADHVIN